MADAGYDLPAERSPVADACLLTGMKVANGFALGLLLVGSRLLCILTPRLCCAHVTADVFVYGPMC